MREFYLLNGKGNRYSLMDVKHWLHDPSNLGANFSSKYEQVGANFIRTKRIPSPDDPSGEILFTGENKYQDYSDFIRFVSIEPLTLIYVSSDEYRASVDLVSIDKSEIKEGTLACTINFKRLGRWYKRHYIYNEGDMTGGKVYDYNYDYTYIDMEPETAIVQSDSGYESPTQISIYGPCQNPIWKHYLNNEVVGTGSVQADIIDGHRLVIDCTKIPYTVHELNIDGEVVEDLYSKTDFTEKRFFFLGYGKNRIIVDHDGTNKLKLAVEARVEYETV